MGGCPSAPRTQSVSPEKKRDRRHSHMAAQGNSAHPHPQEPKNRSADKHDERHPDARVRGRPEPTDDEADGMYNDYVSGDQIADETVKDVSFDNITSEYSQPPQMKDMEDVQDKDFIFMIEPWKYNPNDERCKPKPMNDENGYADRWDEKHVRMPCSERHIDKNKQQIWSRVSDWLKDLKAKCDSETATCRDLKSTIEVCAGCSTDMRCLEKLIDEIYTDKERTQFLHHTLSKMCDLVLSLPRICTRPPPLLHTGSNGSVTMSQRQAASLLACAFFCLFPYRFQGTSRKEYENYPNPNFDRLYENGPSQKIEKLKCIIHYFQRVTEQMPTGVITFQRFVLSQKHTRSWVHSNTRLCRLHVTTRKKIEDINNTLQVDFANKYIGGGVLGNGCVQEEIRFSICPEMLVSLLVCDRMEVNECIFLIGCERYSSYTGYANSFRFDGDYIDTTPKDNWGRKWCHLVAMDAIFFRDPSTQYQMKNVDRELLKAYTSFCPVGKGPEYEFGIATGNWGCGAFNGNRQLKAIIQLMAASEAERPLIYAAFGDKKLANSFETIYEHLVKQNATVGDLYQYLLRYSDRYKQVELFDYIFRKPVASLRH